MPRLKSLEDLRALRAEVLEETKIQRETNTLIIVGMGTCGIAAGARETMRAILRELEARDIEAHVKTVGCIGMCAKEPLVDIRQGDEPRITYGYLTAEKVPHLIEEHLIKGNVVEEWVVGKLRDA
ncbi:MAG: (2Fe-2S) ferredoxin domain-containing protein [Chloroflexota bacterium]|nr:(2Fe-2S) ferredoxin domain-containing protein [Chloroflexota bacterium]